MTGSMSPRWFLNRLCCFFPKNNSPPNCLTDYEQCNCIEPKIGPSPGAAAGAPGSHWFAPEARPMRYKEAARLMVRGKWLERDIEILCHGRIAIEKKDEEYDVSLKKNLTNSYYRLNVLSHEAAGIAWRLCRFTATFDAATGIGRVVQADSISAKSKRVRVVAKRLGVADPPGRCNGSGWL